MEDTEELLLDDEAVVALCAGIVDQALSDFRAGRVDPAWPDAGAFLHAAGLLNDAGELDPRLPQPNGWTDQRARRGLARHTMGQSRAAGAARRMPC